MSEHERIDTAAVAVKAYSRPELLRLPYILKSTNGCGVKREAEMTRKRSAKAYRFRLCGSVMWLLFVGSVRNRGEAERALIGMFGDHLAEVRVHPVCDPWSKTRENLRTAGKPMPRGGDHGLVA